MSLFREPEKTFTKYSTILQRTALTRHSVFIVGLKKYSSFLLKTQMPVTTETI